MNGTILLTLLLALGADEPESPKARHDRLARMHRGDAMEYTIYRDASRAEKLDFHPEPVYVWTNPARGSQQDGMVFLWTGRGRPEAIGTIFSSTDGKGNRGVTHEFHSLSLGTLAVDRRGTHPHLWEPGAPGIELTPMEGAPAPAGSAVQRLAQMRAMAREHSATTEDAKGGRWDLRLLAQPLYRYESTDPEVVDGGLFAFVTSAGTDPEVLLILEARRRPGDDRPAWYRGLARFTDLTLSVRYKDREVLPESLARGDLLQMYKQQQYRLFVDRIIPDVPDASAEGARP